MRHYDARNPKGRDLGPRRTGPAWTQGYISVTPLSRMLPVLPYDNAGPVAPLRADGEHPWKRFVRLRRRGYVRREDGAP